MMGALFLGPRIGKCDRDGRPRTMSGHSVAFAVVGVLVLWSRFIGAALVFVWHNGAGHLEAEAGALEG